MGIEFVGLVHIAHDDLGFSGVGQKWNTSGLFDFVDNPIVVADGFKGDRSSFREIGKELKNCTGLVIDPRLFSG